MLTQFKVQKSDNSPYIYSIPECDLPRLKKGDHVMVCRYAKGNINDNRETWEVVVVFEPLIKIHFSRDHPDTSAYDDGSVSTIQGVTVKVISRYERFTKDEECYSIGGD